MVHEVLEGVGEHLDRLEAVRRQAGVAELLDEHGEVAPGEPGHGPVGQSGQRTDHQAGRADRVALADEQVGDQVLGGPAATERRRVLAEAEGRVAEGMAFAARQRGSRHASRLAARE